MSNRKVNIEVIGGISDPVSIKISRFDWESTGLKVYGMQIGNLRVNLTEEQAENLVDALMHLMGRSSYLAAIIDLKDLNNEVNSS